MDFQARCSRLDEDKGEPFLGRAKILVSIYWAEAFFVRSMSLAVPGAVHTYHTVPGAAVTLLLHLSRNHPARQVEVVDVTGAVIITQGPEHLTQGATHDLTTPVTGD